MALKLLWIKILFIKLTNSSKHSLMLAKTSIEVHLMHEFMPLEPFLVFLLQTCPINYYRSKNQVLDGFRHFVAAPEPLRKLVSRCIQSTSLCLENHFLFGRNEHAQSTTLGLKLMFAILLDTSMHFYVAFDDR